MNRQKKDIQLKMNVSLLFTENGNERCIEEYRSTLPQYFYESSVHQEKKGKKKPLSEYIEVSEPTTTEDLILKPFLSSQEIDLSHFITGTNEESQTEKKEQEGSAFSYTPFLVPFTPLNTETVSKKLEFSTPCEGTSCSPKEKSISKNRQLLLNDMNLIAKRLSFDDLDSEVPESTPNERIFFFFLLFMLVEEQTINTKKAMQDLFPMFGSPSISRTTPYFRRFDVNSAVKRKETEKNEMTEYQSKKVFHDENDCIQRLPFQIYDESNEPSSPLNTPKPPASMDWNEEMNSISNEISSKVHSNSNLNHYIDLDGSKESSFPSPYKLRQSTFFHFSQFPKFNP